MDETHTIAEALPTQFRGRAARPTAIKLVEDMMPRDLFVAHVMGGGNLLPSNYPALAVVNRSFNETMCQPKVIMFRGATAWTSGAKAEARKWYEIATERFPCARSNGLFTDDDASRNPTLAAAWALAMANPQHNLQAQLAAAQAALHAAEAEEGA
jgi:hypothetical protein